MDLGGGDSLVEDIYDRGLADRVLVLVWGEFGRTPADLQRLGRARSLAGEHERRCSPAAA